MTIGSLLGKGPRGGGGFSPLLNSLLCKSYANQKPPDSYSPNPKSHIHFFPLPFSSPSTSPLPHAHTGKRGGSVFIKTPTTWSLLPNKLRLFRRASHSLTKKNPGRRDGLESALTVWFGTLWGKEATPWKKNGMVERLDGDKLGTVRLSGVTTVPWTGMSKGNLRGSV